MNDYIIVSAFTPNYTEDINRLIKSLKKFNLPYNVYPFESKGSWLHNVQYKIDVLIQAINEYKDKDIVWVDADGVIKQYPILFDSINDDISFRVNFRNLKRKNLRGLTTGTLYLKNNNKVKNFLMEWKLKTRKMGSTEQSALYEMITDNRFYDLNIGSLPISYTIIGADIKNDYRDIIISHTSSSTDKNRNLKANTNSM